MPLPLTLAKLNGEAHVARRCPWCRRRRRRPRPPL
uniref:Uncharacterized protein n=1 Tax=Arundo donax TaxID=35708 RepID=A0A0A9BB11_ARUDO